MYDFQWHWIKKTSYGDCNSRITKNPAIAEYYKFYKEE